MEHLTWADGMCLGTVIGAILGGVIVWLVLHVLGLCGTLKAWEPVITPPGAVISQLTFTASPPSKSARTHAGRGRGSRSSRTSSSRRSGGRRRSRSK